MLIRHTEHGMTTAAQMMKGVVELSKGARMGYHGQTVMFTVLSGSFANQAEAFRVLLTEAAEYGIRMSPEDADVIREAREVRLTHYFRPAIVARLETACGDDDTMIVLFPSLLTAEPQFPSGTGPLRLLGRFAGTLPDE